MKKELETVVLKQSGSLGQMRSAELAYHLEKLLTNNAEFRAEVERRIAEKQKKAEVDANVSGRNV